MQHCTRAQHGRIASLIYTVHIKFGLPIVARPRTEQPIYLTAYVIFNFGLYSLGIQPVAEDARVL